MCVRIVNRISYVYVLDVNVDSRLEMYYSIGGPPQMGKRFEYNGFALIPT